MHFCKIDASFAAESLFIWDEPANYLDLFNQDQLIKLLAKE